MWRHVGRVHLAHAHPAADALALELPFGVFAAIGHRVGLGCPAEYLRVEVLRRVHVARGELVPREAARRVHDFGALVFARLPDREYRAGWILEHGHRAL